METSLGPVAGIVGAGGNAGAVFAGLLFRFGGFGEPTALLILGILVSMCAFFAFLVRFSTADETAAAEEFDRAMARRREERKKRVPLHELIPGVRHLRPMDALRIYLGIALVIKGIYFITNMAELENTVSAGIGEEFGLGQTMIAWSVVFAHVIGGASLMLGFVTRVAAAANAMILQGAIVLSLMATPSASSLLTTNTDFQFSAFVFFTLVLFIWRGSGPLSVDHLMRLDAEQEPEIL